RARRGARPAEGVSPAALRAEKAAVGIETKHAPLVVVARRKLETILAWRAELAPGDAVTHERHVGVLAERATIASSDGPTLAGLLVHGARGNTALAQRVGADAHCDLAGAIDAIVPV